MEKFRKMGMAVVGIAVLAFCIVPQVYGFVSYGPVGSSPLPGSQKHWTPATNSLWYAAYGVGWYAVDRTLIIMEGTYNVADGPNNIGDVIQLFGVANTVIKGEPGKVVTLKGWFQLGNVNNFTIQGLHIVVPQNAYAVNLVSINKGVQVLDNYITAEAPLSGYRAVYFESGTHTDVLVQGNVIYNAGELGIGGGATMVNMLIDSNTIYNTTIGIGLWGSSTGKISNNLISNVPGTHGIVDWGTGTTILEYNCTYITGIGKYPISGNIGTGNINVNPMFFSVDPANPDFLYLSCSTPQSVLTGASDGGFIGALPQVVCNIPPVANAGPDQLDVEATSPAGANISLNGSGSTLGDGNHLHYHWITDLGVITEDGVNPDNVDTANAVLTLGVNQTAKVTLTVYDANASHVEDDSDSDTPLTANVVDTTIPVVEILKPQNGEVSPSAAIPVKVRVTDNTATTVSVSMNERIFILDANGIAEGLLIQPKEEIEITAVAVDKGGNTGSDTNTLIKVHDLGKRGN